MAYSTLMQTLIFVVATSACFLAVCGAPHNSTMTAAPMNLTTTAMMTTAPHNATTPAHNTTIGPSNSTTAPTNMTTMVTNTTTLPINTTTLPINTTTLPINTTTLPINTTTLPSNMTTLPSNTTTLPSNTTTVPSNMTTTTPVITTAMPEQRWKVKGKDGKLCMLMDFDGSISYKKLNQQILPTATITKSSCNSTDWSRFVLEMRDQTNIWQLILNFTGAGHSYKLHGMMVNLYQQDQIVDYGNSMPDLFSVPDGDYYHCDSLNITAGPFMVNMTNPTFQPFVKKTKDGNVGDVHYCSNGSSGGHAKIIVGIVIGLIALGAAIAVTYYVVKRRGQPSEPPYARVQ